MSDVQAQAVKSCRGPAAYRTSARFSCALSSNFTKILSFIDNILFYLISSTFFDRKLASRSEEYAIFLPLAFGQVFFFFHVKEKKRY